MEQVLLQLQSLSTACAARNQKQQSKQLLHTLLNVDQTQWDSFFNAYTTPDEAATQLLSVLQRHLELPHPWGSITATCMAFQLLEHLMQHLCQQSSSAQQQAQHRVKQEQLDAAAEGPDSQQGRDTSLSAVPAQNCPAGPIPVHSMQQLQLLCHLHACAGLCWQAAVTKPSDLGLARHTLQYHAAAQASAVLIYRYCSTQGIQQQLQELLLALLLHGRAHQLCPADQAAAPATAAGKAGTAAAVSGTIVLVKQEPSSQAALPCTKGDQARTDDTNSYAQQQQLSMLTDSSTAPKQPTVPLLASLKALMRSSKAFTAAAKASNRNSSSTPPPQQPTSTGAAGAAAGADVSRSPSAALQTAFSASAAARAEELSVSGIKTWALVASQLGPNLLDKAVGQPMLDVSYTVCLQRC
jgi:hypothetical protein